MPVTLPPPVFPSVTFSETVYGAEKRRIPGIFRSNLLTGPPPKGGRFSLLHWFKHIPGVVPDGCASTPKPLSRIIGFRRGSSTVPDSATCPVYKT